MALFDAVRKLFGEGGAEPRLAAACDDGFVYMLGESFEPQSATETGGRPLLVGTATGPEGARLLVGTRESVVVVRL